MEDKRHFVQKKKEEREQRQRQRMEQVRQKRLQEAARMSKINGNDWGKADVTKANRVSSAPTVSRKSLYFPSTVKQTLSSKLRTEKMKDQISKSQESIPVEKAKIIPLKSAASVKKIEALSQPKPKFQPRQSMVPVKTNTIRKSSIPNKQSVNVFDRLYKPKIVPAAELIQRPKPISKPELLKTRKSVCVQKFPVKSIPNVRRSLSAVHFKHLNPGEANRVNYLRRSISTDFGKAILEDDIEQSNEEAFIILPVKSDMKKSVKFLTPVNSGIGNTSIAFLNTPKPSILRQRLADWLLKRGKSIGSFHHLQCFGIQSSNAAFTTTDKPAVELLTESLLEDENKENVEIVDDHSINDIMGIASEIKTEPDMNAWRNSSYDIINDTLSSTSGDAVLADFPIAHTPDVKMKTTRQSLVMTEVTSALGDLLQLMLEGYDVQQCVEWLRAIKRRCPDVTLNSTYWECRAALEDKRGDFYKAVNCWKRAVEEGAQPTIAEASLDGILEKFMKLQLSPNATNPIDPKLVDVKNIFKTTIIRFAINERREKRGADGGIAAKYTATPVRRSTRLLKTPILNIDLAEKEILMDVKDKTPETLQPHSIVPIKSAQRSAKRTPLIQLCKSLRNIDDNMKESIVFVPNKALQFTDSP